MSPKEPFPLEHKLFIIGMIQTKDLKKFAKTIEFTAAI